MHHAMRQESKENLSYHNVVKIYLFIFGLVNIPSEVNDRLGCINIRRVHLVSGVLSLHRESGQALN